MSTVIKVENLSKQYRLGDVGTGTISHDVNRWWHKIRGKEDPYIKIGEVNDRAVKGDMDYVWALKDINFEVKQGEVLGIIGRNGAGKSTLLKILSRTTAPTTGSVKIKGRVASLLEVGTGFHPELSGRDNIFLNGAIMGMTRREIQSKFDEIVDFAGVERYIDTPVKRYSSGMYVRLAFAVAAHLDPEILIVDEVLAVGDLDFQKKALGKIRTISNNQGKAVLFVSHNLKMIRALCSTGMILTDGLIELKNQVGEVINCYTHKSNVFSSPTWINNLDIGHNTQIEKIIIVDINDLQKTDFTSNEEVVIKIYLSVISNINHLKVGFDLIKDDEIVFRTEQIDSIVAAVIESGSYCFECHIPANILNEGIYQIKPLLSIHCVKSLTRINDSVLSFSVVFNNYVTEYHDILNERNHPGYFYPFLKWNLIKT